MSAAESLPSDLAAAHAMILAERAARIEAEAVAANASKWAAAVSSGTEALIARLKLEIEKLQRELYGSRSERTPRGFADPKAWLADVLARIADARRADWPISCRGTGRRNLQEWRHEPRRSHRPHQDPTQ